MEIQVNKVYKKSQQTVLLKNFNRFQNKVQVKSLRIQHLKHFFHIYHMQILPEYFIDELIFDSISGYLQVSDLLRLSQANKLLKSVVQSKCKRIIKHHKLTFIPSKTGIHQMRFYFDRCLTIYRKKEDFNESKLQKIQKTQKTQKAGKQKNRQFEKDKQKEKDKEYINNIVNDKTISYALELTIENPFKFKTIIYFEVGVQYTVCLTIENEAFIFKTSALINLKQNKKTQLNYQKRLNVAQIKCKSEQITYIKQNGEIFQIFGQKNNEKLLEKQQKLNWCQFIEVQSIQASFNCTIFKPKQKALKYQAILKYVFGYDIDLKLQENLVTSENQTNQDKSNNAEMTKIKTEYHENQNQKTRLILFNNISFKYYVIQFQKSEEIISIAVGSRQAYFLNHQRQCFVCYFQQEFNNQNNLNDINQNNNKIIKAKVYEPFIFKSIIKIVSGYNFFIALERKIHEVSKWTVDQVCKWVRQIGFGQFAKICSVQKVNGNKLLVIDKNYMHSSLGITKLNMQQKFLMLLEEVKENKNKQDTLYGWGKNQNGQLGSRNANYIKEPQKIKIPICLKESQYIDSIFCGWFQTFIRTQKGRVYRTVNFEKKKKGKDNSKDQGFNDNKGASEKGSLNASKNSNQNKKVYADYQDGYDSQHDFEQKKNFGKNQKSYNSKKKRKYTQDQIKKETGHKKFQQEQKWVQCQLGKAFFVQGFKDILFYIQCPSQNHFEPAKQKKLRTAKMLLNKIIWSHSPEEQQFYKVGYMDKDMGLIQISIFELKTFDYNQNRIRYIKKTNQIVWDRQNKIDHFG